MPSVSGGKIIKLRLSNLQELGLDLGLGLDIRIRIRIRRIMKL